jgi:hypothetical protein
MIVAEYTWRGMTITIDHEGGNSLWEAEIRAKGVLLGEVAERSHKAALAEAKRRVDLLLEKPR